MRAHPCSRSGTTRRGFLIGTALGLGAGLTGGWLAGRKLPLLLPLNSVSAPPESSASPNVMPGRYPGRVIEVRHPHAVIRDTAKGDDNVINRPVVEQMLDRGMAELVGADDPRDVKGVWRTFFQPGDVVGIKVNPVGLRSRSPSWPGAVGAISSPELVVKIVRNLQEAGVARRNIIVFDRYAPEFCEAGYKDLVEKELTGVRWMCASAGYTDTQLDVTGFDTGRNAVSAEVGKHVVGYDPDVFTTMGYCAAEHSKHDDRRFRSHLTVIVSRFINKMITLPVLKDHRSAGVTLALKNMSHGMNNNVARSHLAGIAHGFGPAGKVLGPNQCNTFIPQAVGQHRLREKATLHILDGLVGVYEGGPGMWNRTWGTWRHKGLFFATDPVALDHVCWDVIDRKREEEGWAPVERMGWLAQTPELQVASAVTPLGGGHDALATACQAYGAVHVIQGRSSEVFNVRQPDHVMLAGHLGLGEFDRERITYQRIELRG